MPSSLIKGGMAAAGVGGAGLGGWAISNHIKSNNTVKAILVSKGHKLTSSLPTSEQGAAWEKALNTYKLEGIGDLQIQKGNVSATDIKNWCSENLGKQSNDSTLKKASRWCVLYSSFKDKLDEEGRVLETDLSSLQTKYNSLGSLTEEVKKVTPDSGSENENGRKLKKWCETMIHLSYRDDDAYQTFKGHCSKVSG
ncbi:hypothetical protein HF1_06200 [Mycoplasma haemofelis str. Langford 1]|uniref:Uncharacterized protein n=1 Tax=Mycoplasma haemofelis (strain Langford 1) TaxID=941640 RepID=E8ZHK7_MYCHL|nr:hypothetical protein [Mycoplasma haemofelis]CBY92628.1 hypothetical protein HF1_06200 [Mycoplasma haemofelis str. Langford 1]